MVIYYDNTGTIKRSEDFVMSPVFPDNHTMAQKVEYYDSIGLKFVSLNYEVGIDIFNYKVLTDDNNKFYGLEPLPIEEMARTQEERISL